jgi:MFS family permease
MFGQAIGPVFGGTLAQFLGYRSIFWFLFGLALMVIVLTAFLLPETLRKIAGNGSLQLYGIYRPLINLRRGSEIPKENRYVPSRLSFSMLMDSFKLLLEKDVLVTLIFGGFTYAVWSMITSSTASLFKDEYKLDDVQIGLVFLPNGSYNTCPFNYH